MHAYNLSIVEVMQIYQEFEASLDGIHVTVPQKNKWKITYKILLLVKFSMNLTSWLWQWWQTCKSDIPQEEKGMQLFGFFNNFSLFLTE